MGRSADHLRPGARAFVHGSYLIVYRPMAYGIAVLRVAHGAQALELLEYPPPPARVGQGGSSVSLQNPLNRSETELGVAHGMRDVAVAEVLLDRARVVVECRC